MSPTFDLPISQVLCFLLPNHSTKTLTSYPNLWPFLLIYLFQLYGWIFPSSLKFSPPLTSTLCYPQALFWTTPLCLHSTPNIFSYHVFPKAAFLAIWLSVFSIASSNHFHSFNTHFYEDNLPFSTSGSKILYSQLVLLDTYTYHQQANSNISRIKVMILPTKYIALLTWLLLLMHSTPQHNSMLLGSLLLISCSMIQFNFSVVLSHLSLLFLSLFPQP